MTVIFTMQQATIPGAGSTQGHALMVGEARKLPAHGDTCQAVGVSFITLLFGDTWGDECFSSRHTGLPRASSGSTFGDPPC